jgi:hypothetical protein
MNNIKKYCVVYRFVFLIIGFETVKNVYLRQLIS